MKRAVIFSGGAFEKPDWVALPKDAMILCADSGLRHARALGISPDWVLGDFDSSSEQPEGESVLRYPPVILTVYQVLERHIWRVLTIQKLSD